MGNLSENNNQNQGQNFSEDEIDLRALFNHYLRNWKLIGVCLFLGFCVAFVYYKLAVPIYSIEATVLVKEDTGNLGMELFETGGLFQGKSNLENEIGILKSYTIAKETIQELNFNTAYFEKQIFGLKEIYKSSPILVVADWTHFQLTGGLIGVKVISDNEFLLTVEDENFKIFNPADPIYKLAYEEGISINGKYKFGEEIVGANFKFNIENLSALAGEELYFNFKDFHTLAISYKNDIRISPLNKAGSILTVGLDATNTKKGVDYLNTFLETYLSRELNEKNRNAENTIKFIDAQLSGLTDSLNFVENKLENYRSENRIFNLSNEGTQIFLHLQELEKERSEYQLNLKYFESLLSYLSEDRLGELSVPSLIGLSDPLLNALVINLSELQNENASLSGNFSDQTPAVREIKRKIETTKRSLQENVSSAIVNTKTQLAEIDNNINRIEREVQNLPETERKLMSIQREFDVNENIYVYLLQKRAEAEISKAANIPSNSIIDFARPQEQPISPKKSLILLIGLVLGLIIPIAVITAKDFLNNKITDIKELENSLSVPVLSAIGKNMNQESNLLMNNIKSPMAEAFRGLRSDISYLSSKDKGLTILCTSSISGEGKTFAAINLASVYALIGKKTILIGLDLRKPKLAEEFGVNNSQGVSTYLAKNVNWRDLLLTSVYDNFDVLLSGPIPPNPAELLMKPKFSSMMEEIKKEYDVVILDCPPVGLVSETKEIFKFSDVNFYLFRSSFSDKQSTAILNNLVNKGGVKNIYAILNDVEFNKNTAYGYGYGYSENKVKKRKTWKTLFL